MEIVSRLANHFPLHICPNSSHRTCIRARAQFTHGSRRPMAMSSRTPWKANVDERATPLNLTLSLFNHVNCYKVSSTAPFTSKKCKQILRNLNSSLCSGLVTFAWSCHLRSVLVTQYTIPRIMFKLTLVGNRNNKITNVPSFNAWQIANRLQYAGIQMHLPDQKYTHQNT